MSLPSKRDIAFLIGLGVILITFLLKGLVAMILVALAYGTLIIVVHVFIGLVLGLYEQLKRRSP